LGGENVGGQGDFVTTAPVALSFLVGPGARLYEKKMRVRVAFEPTRPYRTTLPLFFAYAAHWLPRARRATRAVCWSALACLLLVSATQAQEASTGGEPSWAVEVAPDSLCAGDPGFRDRLSAAIPGRQRAAIERAELRARVAIARDRSASLSVFDQLTQREAGQRRITLPRGGCNEAAEALALVIAVMVEAGRSLMPVPEAPAEPPPEPPPEPARQPEPEQAGPATYKRPERYAWQGPPAGHDLTLQVGLGLGLLPGDSLGGNVGWGIRGSRIWPVWLEATGWLNQPSQDLHGRIGAAYGILSICPLYLTKGRALRGRLCPGFAAGALWASGHKLPEVAHDVSFLTLATLVAALHVQIVGPLELVLSARMEVPLVRANYVYRGADGESPQIHETAVITGSFFGGLGLCFR
jgi:hypothetical protein